MECFFSLLYLFCLPLNQYIKYNVLNLQANFYRENNPWRISFRRIIELR